MNKRLIIRTSINFFGIVIISFLLGFAIKEDDFGDFTKKSYYKEIFDQNEISKLASIDSRLSKAYSNLEKIGKLDAKYSAYEKVYKQSKDDKEKKKAYKQTQKYAKKITSISDKNYTQTDKANTEKYNIYSNKLSTYTFDNSAFHKAAKDSLKSAIQTFEKAKSLRAKSSTSKAYEQYKLQKEADLNQKSAIRTLEIAFGLYKKDNTIKIQGNTDNSVVEEVEENAVYTSNYKPENDKNLYISRIDKISGLLLLEQEDSELLAQADKLQKEGDELKTKVENSYVKIEQINRKIEQSTDRKFILASKQQAETLEINIFAQQISSCEKYLKANEIRYQIYKKYIEKKRPEKQDAKKEAGKKFEENAVSLYSKSLKIIADAKLRPEKHLKYMGYNDAVSYQLAAIAMQENALSTYLDLPANEMSKIVPEDKQSDNKVVDNKTDNKKSDNKKDNTKKDNTKKDTVKKDENKATDNNTGKKENSKFEYQSTFVYTAEKPSPEKYTAKQGIVFKVQAGIFKDNISIVKYAKYSPVTYDTYKNNELKKFMVGEYKTIEAAEFALKELKKTYKDAFIIAFKNGNKIDNALAIKELVKNENYKKNLENELAVLSGKPVDNKKDEAVKDDKKETVKDDKKETVVVEDKTKKDQTKEDKKVSKFNSVSDIKELFYSVQLGFYSTPKNVEDFKNMNPVFEEKTEKGYKYMSGKFKNYKDALAENDKIRKAGFEKSFVIAYNSGKSISLQEAKALETTPEKSDNKAVVEENGIEFSVQLAAYALKLTENEEKAIFGTVTKKHQLVIRTEKDGLATYSVGKEKTWEQIVKLKEQLEKDGQKNIFITAYNNGKKIEVAKAKQMLKQNN